MTKDQVEQEFRTELRALLKKYNAEMEATEFWDGWKSDIRIDVTIPAVCEGGQSVREWTDFDLNKHISCKNV